MITVPSWMIYRLDVPRIIRSMKVTDSVITGAADDPPARRPSGDVAAQTIAAKLLESLGDGDSEPTRSIGPVRNLHGPVLIWRRHRRVKSDTGTGSCKEAEGYLGQMLEDQGSVEGVVECINTGLPAGIGEPVLQLTGCQTGHAEMSVSCIKRRGRSVMALGEAKAVGSIN